jgi:hypothetical protein
MSPNNLFDRGNGYHCHACNASGRKHGDCRYWDNIGCDTCPICPACHGDTKGRGHPDIRWGLGRCPRCQGGGVLHEDDCRHHDHGPCTRACPPCGCVAAWPGDPLAALVAATRALIAALPACDECSRPATRAIVRGGARRCDLHGASMPDYPRAIPLRKLHEMLDTLDKTNPPRETPRQGRRSRTLRPAR